MDKKMQKALEADGEKLRQLTGEDHGPYFVKRVWKDPECPKCGLKIGNAMSYCCGHNFCPLA